MRTRLGEVPAAQAHRAGAAVAERILALPEVAAAPRVALYAALPDELPTRVLFDGLRRRGTRTLLPRSLEDGRLGFAALERWEDLAPGRYGVREPAGPQEALGPRDVVVVPGLAFDAAGRRLGRGRGFYDRSFPAGGEPGAWLVGVGYAFQCVPEVPAGPGDRAMDAVATERSLLRPGGGEGKGERP